MYSSGIGQQTMATQALTRQLMPGSVTRSSKPRRRKAKAAAAVSRKRTKRKASGGKFVKGSAAAKRHMAKLRRMRRR
jgi:hypothetical protein